MLVFSTDGQNGFRLCDDKGDEDEKKGKTLQEKAAKFAVADLLKRWREVLDETAAFLSPQSLAE